MGIVILVPRSFTCSVPRQMSAKTIVIAVTAGHAWTSSPPMCPQSSASVTQDTMDPGASLVSDYLHTVVSAVNSTTGAQTARVTLPHTTPFCVTLLVSLLVR